MKKPFESKISNHKSKIFFLVFTFSFVLLGCNNQTIVDDSGEIEPGQMTEGEFLAEMDATGETMEFTGFLGPWTRTATYVNGALEHTTPASLTFYPDLSYESATDACSTSGTFEEIEEGTVKMIMTNDNCQDQLPLPFTITYTYELGENDDGVQTMTMYTGPVMETYVR